jgi:signal transduction histidine kinase
VTGLLELKIVEKNIAVDIKIAPTLPSIKGDPHQLQQVFINLFLNSLHALPPGGTIEITAELVRHQSADDNGMVDDDKLRINFEDNGAGIAAEHLAKVFDPFFTTKDVGEGTGLGLSVAYGIIKDHQGEIRVDSRPGAYTRFEIVLPAATIAPVGIQREVAA